MIDSATGAVPKMSASDPRIPIRHSLGLPRLRAALAGLGHASALMAFVILATALQKTATGWAHAAPSIVLASFVEGSITLCAALAACLPILVASCNFAPSGGV